MLIELQNITVDNAGNIINQNTKKQYRKIRNNRYIRLENGSLISLKKVFKEVLNQNICKDNISDLNGEEWKQIDFDYYVSNCGRVKSKSKWKAIILKQHENNRGYKRVEIHKKKILTHKLVAKYFLKQPTEKHTEIHHIDLNKKNNHLNNLIYLTKKQHNEIHKQICENAQKGVNVNYEEVLHTILREYPN